MHLLKEKSIPGNIIMQFCRYKVMQFTVHWGDVGRIFVGNVKKNTIQREYWDKSNADTWTALHMSSI